MKSNQILGEKGEQLAVEYLQKLGYMILERNWRIGHKEVDIICMKNECVIFVEVKTRKTTRLGMPEESVSERKIKSITDAALLYLQEKKYNDIRFDVISIILKNENNIELLHIKDAFY